MARRWTLGEQLGQARRRRFVGRRAELDLFAAALSVPEPPFTVLHVHGPGGVGKSALLHGFAEVASDAVDPEGFAAFAARLPAGLREIIQQGEPVGDPIRFTFPASVRNRHERLCTRVPSPVSNSAPG